MSTRINWRSDVDRRLAMALALEGFSGDVIARACRLTRGQVSYVLRQAGFGIRSYSRAANPYAESKLRKLAGQRVTVPDTLVLAKRRGEEMSNRTAPLRRANTLPYRGAGKRG